MLIQITIDTTVDTPDRVANIMDALTRFDVAGDYPAETSAQQFATARTVTPAEHLARQQASAATTDTKPAAAGAMTAEELIASTTLKPTATTGIGDGGKVAVGDYVMCNDEKWQVAATYRGMLVAVNEDGGADALKAEDCRMVPAEAREPRPGTAAALLGGAPATTTPADGDGPISDENANALRERATNLIVAEKATVDALMAELERLHPGATNISHLTAAQGVEFEKWVKGAEEGKNKAFGF